MILLHATLACPCCMLRLRSLLPSCSCYIHSLESPPPTLSILHAKTPKSTICISMLHTKPSESTTWISMLHTNTPEYTTCTSILHPEASESTTCTPVLHARTTKSPSVNLYNSLTCYSLNCKIEHPDHQHLYLYRSVPYHFSLLPFLSLLFLPSSRLVWNFDIKFCYILMQFCNKVQENFTLDPQNWGYRVDSRVSRVPLCPRVPMIIPILNFIFPYIIQLLGK